MFRETRLVWRNQLREHKIPGKFPNQNTWYLTRKPINKLILKCKWRKTLEHRTFMSMQCSDFSNLQIAIVLEIVSWSSLRKVCVKMCPLSLCCSSLKWLYLCGSYISWCPFSKQKYFGGWGWRMGKNRLSILTF